MTKVRESGMPARELWESFFDVPGILDAFGAGHIDGDAVEFGCGYGTFTIPLAARTSGTVFALDIEPDMIAATAERALHAGVANVHAEQRDFISNGTGRRPASVAFAALFNILHMEAPVALLAETRRILRPGGVVAVLHWLQDARTPRGPPLPMRPSPEDCARWGDVAGLVSLGPRRLPGTAWHWGLLLALPS
jgi:SAM-dependent methyltransferase